ncbi:hypothetical protein ACFFRR_008393 [Megaselia abdita]
MDQGYGTDLSFKRRRKPSKPIDTQEQRMSYDEESSSTTARASSSLSAHESKILRRRDKAFAGMASRSHSQPRPEDFEFMQVSKRSLSSPRHKEDEIYEPPTPRHPLTEDDRLTRLEKNLQRFEEERKYFDKEKRMFEKEKREHKLRYRQMLDEEQRRKMLENYRKLGDQSSEAEEKKRLIQSLRQSYKESAISQRPAMIRPRYMEESSALESSDTEQVPRPIPPPERKIVSRHHSLSPLRAERLMGMEGVLQEEGIKENIYENLPVKEEPEPERKKSVHELISVPIERPERSVKPVRRSVSRSKADKDTNVVKPLRRRSRASVESEVAELLPTEEPNPVKKSIFSFFTGKKKEKVDEVTPDVKEEDPLVKKKRFFGKYRDVWDGLIADYPSEYKEYQLLRNHCCAHFLALILLCGFGGLLFRYTEGYLENIYKCEIRKVKRDFIDVLWSQSHNMREDDWKSQARNRLRTFEEEILKYNVLHGRSFPGARAWNFVNSVLYCWTVVTTIGYGHIVPQTTLGRSLTIIYAIIGIPIFLILLADFGKVFTRGLKFFWAFARRLYNRGTCRKSKDANQSETFEIDDEFNLPISLASGMLILYILAGAMIYTCWEDWDYFEAFYFVFISMSTIGFGDYVPEHPIFMMCSILYLIFGLALTSMFINVVQIKLSKTFKNASSKLGTTIGLNMAKEASEAGSIKIEVPAVHNKSSLNDISEMTTPPPPVPQRTENVPDSSSPKEVRRKKRVVKK